ncbi:hypothetical protein COO59_19395 [Mixta theicola]|uniref:CdiI immunity protein domain-containing protein n=1 Tax=Mixta theicola TaxID=1458355 RepID=A0A2K1Q4W3_9GAMM|nr:contact-dependent growth inhibition system immunity protein [Mixta theicola]PNS10085.1 hypothetical protein COO59_19395 [Mixta theicola]GLR10551.1 hypothetical protein GCM10007905_32710 [Mixta theicola]
MNRFRNWRLRRKFSSLGVMIRVFFSNHDCDAFGETIEEIVESYCDYNGKAEALCLKNEITEMLQTEDDSELESRMALLAENRCNLKAWGETWRSFLQRVLTLL